MSLKKILAGALTAGMMLSFIPATAMAANKGWVEDDERWYYYVSDTEYLKDTWKEIDGSWYYFLDDGVMAKDGWYFIDGKMYHFDKRGHMEKNKWIEGRKWVDHYDDNGNPVYSEPRWRFVGSDGAAYSGWKKMSGSWYYFDETDTDYVKDYGVMAYGVRYIGGARYYFGDNGKMRYNCWGQDSENRWFYFGSDGKAVSGWKQINGNWYLFQDYNCEMSTGPAYSWDEKDTGFWMLERNGVLTSKTGWYKYKFEYEDDEYWYYIKSGGQCCCDEWYKINGKWYYFDYYGRMVADKSNYLIKDKLYDFASSGVCKNPDSGRKATGWQEVWIQWYGYKVWIYGDKNGNLYKGQWLNYGGSKYYFDYDACMKCSVVSVIDGKLYSFDKDGKAKDVAGNTKGWLELDEGRAYIGSDGKAYTDWQKIDGKWYYFSWNGLAATGRWILDGTQYIFKDNGEMVTGWYDDGDTWYYADSSGNLYQNRWLNYRGSWYYFDNGGIMVHYDWEPFIIKGRGYKFSSDGKCLNPDKPVAAKVWN
ncbi:hypothetical protein [Butyrivibrio sp. AE2032]|uniref:hypothetical protein n=1 Tax=Butyrivibrio sp. AE2032 TaxID=1458463 RepID=UPI0005521201|nr:hypothetical protein [Butyrivibrio sp. AE2032]